MEKITKTQRWLDLIAFLVGRRYPVTIEEIMEAIPAWTPRWQSGSETDRNSIRRTFERDKDELRKLGIPIETVQFEVNYASEQIEGYLLRHRDFYLPYLRLVTGDPADRAAPPKPYSLPDLELSEKEAKLAITALREAIAFPAFPFTSAAKSALRKLAFDLDPDAFEETPVLYIDRPGSEEIIQRMRLLSDALLARKSVRFRYHGIQRGSPTDRSVHPWGLFFQRGNWYLVGFDEDRSDTRVFRVGRMERIFVNRKAPNTADYTVPEEFSLENWLDRESWELGDEPPVRARVLFRFPRSLWAERNRYGSQIEVQADGSSIREFEVQQFNPFLRWLLSLGGDVQLLEPTMLVDELREMAHATASLYAEA